MRFEQISLFRLAPVVVSTLVSIGCPVSNAILRADAPRLSNDSKQESVFPGKSWESRSPMELGLNSTVLDQLATKLGGRGCIIRHGYVAKSWGDQSQVADWLSSAKPVLSTLLFFAIEEGRVKSVDQPIADFGWGLSDKDKSISFRHLGAMTSGYARPDAPGTAWAYNDFAIQLYQMTLFDKVFKDDAGNVAEHAKRLGALQLEDGLVFSKKRRISASVRDFARIAWFWSNRGNWNGKQILPRLYFDQYMQPQVPEQLPHTQAADTNDYLDIKSYGGGSDHFAKCGPGIYGFNWWFNAVGRQHPDTRTWPDAPADTVMSIGAGGNNTAIIPSLGLVIACASGDWNDLHGGDSKSKINQALKLLVSAVHNVPQDKVKPPTSSIRKWQPTSLTFQGPNASEDGTPNPFTDFRLEVAFTKGDRKVVVPGYYAADGNAAETGATSGSTWRVHFLPDEEGTWNYRVHFRQGDGIAIASHETVGSPAAPDGQTGSLHVGPFDPNAKGFYSQGLLKYVGERYLRFAETGKPFLKRGIDSPENFLAYKDFDQTTPTHSYDPHAQDSKSSDPSWKGGKGKNIFGLLNYLESQKVNSIYFLTMNVLGDGKDVWPWTSKDERLRYDCSKLDQWEIVFNQMDRLGLMLHVVHQEQENDQLLDNGELGPERKLYYRELVARFSHHPALVWNFGEENTNTTEQQKSFFKYVGDLDPWKHPRVIHTFPSQIEKVYQPLIGNVDFEGPSFQIGRSISTHKETVKWISLAEAAGRSWFACLDEIGPASICLPPDVQDPEHQHEVREALWGHLMAGGSGVEWIVAYDTWPRVPGKHLDIAVENWRSWENMLKLTNNAIEFFQDHLPFTEMKSADSLLDSDCGWCFAKPGAVYAIYLFGGKKAVLDLPVGNYQVDWFDPWKAGDLIPGNPVAGPGKQFLGPPPSNPTRDWVILVRER